MLCSRTLSDNTLKFREFQIFSKDDQNSQYLGHGYDTTQGPLTKLDKATKTSTSILSQSELVKKHTSQF